MRYIPGALQDHLHSGVTTLCHCWRLDRRDGTVHGFTDHDRPIRFDGITFEPDSGFEAGSLDNATGLSADNIEVIGALSSTTLTERDLERGLYDNADVDIFRVNWAAPAQRILLFRGSVGETTRGSLSFRAELRSMAHRLDQPTGRAYLRRCDAELGDARCGVALTPHDGTITALKGDGSILTNLAATDGFIGGLLTWTSGANSGTRSVIRAVDGASITLWIAPPGPISLSDTFTITEGCDKRWQTCRDRFNNAARFRGFPHMPGDDWMTRTPASGGQNDGAAL